MLGEVLEGLDWLPLRAAVWRIEPSRLGALVGGLIGAVIGVPVPVMGLVIGGFLGAFVGAALFEYTRLRHSGVAWRVGFLREMIAIASTAAEAHRAGRRLTPARAK